MIKYYKIEVSLLDRFNSIINFVIKYIAIQIMKKVGTNVCIFPVQFYRFRYF